MPLFEKVDEAYEMKEMEHWKKEAAKVLEPSDMSSPA
jgi:hypothetical protein